jgi:hypothetical protein
MFMFHPFPFFFHFGPFFHLILSLTHTLQRVFDLRRSFGDHISNTYYIT